MVNTTHRESLATEGFDRLSYWNSLKTGPGSKASTVFNFPLTRCITLSERDRDEINAQVFGIIARSWPGGAGIDTRTPEGRQAVLRGLNETSRFSVDVKGNLDRFVALEVELLEVFGRLGLTRDIVGWQFPIDIRVVHPKPPENYLARKDATDYLHCDPWRGEPKDLVNIVLYCEVSDQASQLELYRVDPDELPRFEAYTGDERDSDFLLEGRSPIAFDHRPGQLIVFDGYLPHRTRRLGDSVRISLNFSLRRSNPYGVIDEAWDRPRQAWQKFWFSNDKKVMTFAERRDEELRRVTATESRQALDARQAALKKYFGAT